MGVDDPRADVRVIGGGVKHSFTRGQPIGVPLPPPNAEDQLRELQTQDRCVRALLRLRSRETDPGLVLDAIEAVLEPPRIVLDRETAIGPIKTATELERELERQQQEGGQ